MYIFYDLELKDIEFFSNITDEERKALTKLREFVSQRLSVLRDEIELEEKQKSNRCTIIEIIPVEKDRRIIFQNYSEPLKRKMASCFSDDDWEYLGKSFTDAF